MRAYTDEHGHVWRAGLVCLADIDGTPLPGVVVDVDPNMGLVCVRPDGHLYAQRRWLNPDAPSNQVVPRRKVKA